MQMLANDIVNIGWTLADPTSSTRTHYPVDIGITKTPISSPLSNYVSMDLAAETFTFNINHYGSQVYTLNGLLFDDYYVSVDATVSTLPAPDFIGLWGIGERVRNFFYENGVYTTSARDAGSPYDTGRSPGSNMYGVHPLYLGKHKQGSYFGVFLLNANAADWWIQNDPASGNIDVNVITIGGVVDLFFIVDTKPENIAIKYHMLVGLPVLVPFWSLGWHQCRWGYTHLTDL